MCSACGRIRPDGQVFLGTPQAGEVVWRRWWVCSHECAFKAGSGLAGEGEEVVIEGPRQSIGGIRMTISPGGDPVSEYYDEAERVADLIAQQWFGGVEVQEERSDLRALIANVLRQQGAVFPSDSPRWWVVYEVAGYGTKKAGPYETLEEAQIQLRDIAGYEGVFNVRLVGQPKFPGGDPLEANPDQGDPK